MGKQQKEIDTGNPILRQIMEGAMIDNPAYNPKKKTKKGELPVPAKIYDSAPAQVGGGVFDNIMAAGQSLHYDNNDLGLTVKEFNNYTEYGADPGPYKTRKELNLKRAQNQSAWEQTGNFITQAVGNEIVLGTALGLSNLVDMAANLGTKEGEDDYTNPISTFLTDRQNEIKEKFEIYRENPDDTFQIGDFGWWADNAISVASTLSMLIPSMAVTKGLSIAGKLGKLDRISMGIAKAAKATNLTKGAYTLGKAINAGAEIGTAALLSRTMEGYLEAKGVYDETLTISKDRLANMSIEDRTKMMNANPEFVGKTDDEIAAHMSSLSADETFKNDYAMLLFDVVQFKALGSMWKGIANKVETSALRTANKGAINSLVNDGEEAVTKLGFLSKRKEIFQNALKNPLTSIQAIQLSEGLEEGYQGIQTEKGKEVAERMLDPEFSNRNLNSYLTDSHIWEQAFWGVLGGVGFQAIGTGFGNAAEAIKGKINKSKMTEQEYALSQITDENIREKEILGRQAVMQSYVESMQLLNEGKNPFGYKIDPLTQKPVIEDGSQDNEDISEDDAEMLKTKLTNEFVTNMVLNAVDKGNYDLFKEFVSNNNFNQFFKEAGLENNAGDTTFANMLTSKMEQVHEAYNESLYHVLNSVNPDNENVAKLVARDMARDILNVEDWTNISNDLANTIATSADGDYTEYTEQERLKYVENLLNEIDNKDIEIRELLANKRISPQAVELINKENKLRRNQLLAYASMNNMFGNPEAINELLKSNIADANTNAFIAEFNKYIGENGINLNGVSNNRAVAPKKSIQDIIKKKIALDDNIDYVESTMLVSQSDYQSRYDEMARGVDIITIERYNKAADDVSKYLEDSEDLDIARDNILTNNVPDELKEKLDILKLGHNSTKRFTAQINAILGTLTKDRAKAAEEAKKVKVDDVIVEAEKAAEEKGEVEAIEEVSDDSSTGKVESSDVIETSDPNQVVVDNYDINEEIAIVDVAADKAAEALANDLLIDNDSRAIGLASSVTFNIFKTSRNLFDNLEGKDVNSSEFNRIVDLVEEELKLQGVSRGYARAASLDGVKMALNMIYRRLNSKGVSGADKFKMLADQLANKQKIVEVDEENKASTTTLINDNEFNKVVDEFIDTYVLNKGIYTVDGSKTIINVDDLFKELLNNDSITYEQAKHIFFNISDYIAASNNLKYVFTNKANLIQNLKTPSTFFANLLTNKTTTEVIDTYMHIAAPKKPADGYNQAINNALNGGLVDITYFQGDKGSSKNSISIKHNGVEIGYLGSVVPNSTNTGYKLVSQNVGLVYDLNKTDGNVNSNLDKFFEPLIKKETKEFKQLMDIAYKQFVYETGIKNNSYSPPISDNDIKAVLSSPAIKELISKNEIKIPDYITTNAKKAAYILTNINNVVFHDANSIAGNISSDNVSDRANVLTASNILESYRYWKSSMFSNYENTHKIQQTLDKDGKISTKLVNTAVGKLLIDSINTDVNTKGFTYQQNPIMIVDANGNIINESNNTSYNNVAGFESGSMGVLIADNPNAPMIALFTEANKLSTNSKLANQVDKELNDLFNGFQSGNITFDNLGIALSNLFSGPGVKSNNLFSGYNVVKTSDRIALNLRGKKGVYSLIVHKFNKGTNVEGTGITRIANGDREKSSRVVNKEQVKDLVKEIVSNLNFNKTFYGVNNKNVEDDNKTNPYLYKEAGKLVVEIGGVKTVYNSFGHFVLVNNAFKTNQGVNKDGSFFDNNQGIKSLYINTASVNLPVEEVSNTTVVDDIKSATKTKSVNSISLLEKVGIDKNKIDILTGNNQYNIAVVPKELFFDNKAVKAEAYYSKGKVYITNKGADNIGKSSNNLVRLLIHENLHGKFEEQGLFQQYGIVDDLFDTYNQMVSSVLNDINSADKTTTRYKRAVLINNWLNSNKFNPNEYINRLSAEQRRIWEKRSEVERNKLFAEEWLVESLTQPTIIRYLNSTNYIGNDINVEGIDNKDKTIWQKIIDVLVKLFGGNIGNIKNNTILAQQYAILGNPRDVNNENEITSREVVEEDNKTNVNGENPILNNELVNTAEEQTGIAESDNDTTQMDEDSGVDDLDFAVTTMIEELDYISNEGIDLAFSNNKELFKIGTAAQYYNYINNIFPNSKVKDILYHGSNYKFDSFNSNQLGKTTGAQSAKEGFFFANNKEAAKVYSEANRTITAYDKLGMLYGGEVFKLKGFEKQLTNLKEQLSIEENNKPTITLLDKILDFINKLINGYSSIEVKLRNPNITSISTNINNLENDITKLKADRKKLDEDLKFIREVYDKHGINYSVENEEHPHYTNNISKFEAALNEVKKTINIPDNYGNFIYPVILNVTNPSNHDQAGKANNFFFTEIIKEDKKANFDSTIIKNTFDPKLLDLYVVYNSSQTHILGSDKDIKGFRDFVNLNNNFITTNDIMIDTYDSDPNPIMTGVEVITNMNDYINQFAPQDKANIAKMVASGEVKFVCS